MAKLPGQIEKLEKQQSQLAEKISEPGFYQSDNETVQRVNLELAEVQARLEAAFNRWDELEVNT